MSTSSKPPSPSSTFAAPRADDACGSSVAPSPAALLELKAPEPVGGKAWAMELRCDPSGASLLLACERHVRASSSALFACLRPGNARQRQC
eukprot:2241035-Rhodomonas_salina.1